MAARLREELTADWSAGMNDSAAGVAYQPNEAALILNGRITPDGAVAVRGGSRRLHATALNSGAQGYGGTTFTANDGTVQWVVFVGDRMYTSEDEGATWTEQATGLTTAFWTFAKFRQAGTNYLVAANGGTSTYKWDGTTWAALSNVPSNVKYVATFNERLWVAGHSGMTVQASEIADFEEWDTADGALSLQVVTTDGDATILGIFPAADRLLVFKRNSTSFIDGFGSSDLIVAAGARGASGAVGCVAPRSVVAAGEGQVVWLSERGLELYALGGQIQLLSERLRGFFQNVSWSDILANPMGPCAVYYPLRNEVIVALPGAGGFNNYAVAVNMTNGAMVLWNHTAEADNAASTISTDADGYVSVSEDTSESKIRTQGGYMESAEGAEPGLYLDYDDDGYQTLLEADFDHAVLFTADSDSDSGLPISVSYEGFVRRLDTGSNDDELVDGTAGVEIAFKLRTRPLLFGAPFERKWARLVEVLGEADSASAIEVDLVADGTVATTMDATVPVAAGSVPQWLRLFPTGRGRTIQVELRSEASPLEIAGIKCRAELLRR